MPTCKELFQKDRKLCDWWVSIAHDDRFAQVCTFARAAVMQARVSQEQAIGGEMVLSLLENLAEPTPDFSEMPTSGLHHNFNPTPDTDKPQIQEA